MRQERLNQPVEPAINCVGQCSEATHISASSAGEAIGSAIGSAVCACLAGHKTVAICQNSSLGNMGNPLTNPSLGIDWENRERMSLAALGLKQGSDFQLNLPADNEVKREIDAEIATRRGKVRVDVALIGAGNQEVSEDKLSRVGNNGIVLVDKLGSKSKVPGNAEKAGVHITIIRNHLPLSDLYNHLVNLMPDGVILKEPPTEPKKIEKLLNQLPDDIFYVPTITGSTVVETESLP